MIKVNRPMRIRLILARFHTAKCKCDCLSVCKTKGHLGEIISIGVAVAVDGKFKGETNFKLVLRLALRSAAGPTMGHMTADFSRRAA